MRFFKKVWGVVKKVAPVAIGFALGGPAGAAIGGAAGSALRGGNLSQILQGAGYGYGAGSLGSALGSAYSAYGAPLQGPTMTGATLSGTGGASAAMQSLLNSSGLTGVGNFITDPVTGIKTLASKGVDSLSNVLSGTGGNAGSTVAGAGAGGGGSSFLPTVLNLASGFANTGAINKTEDQILEEQRRNLELNQPYLDTGNQANKSLQERLAEFTSTYKPEDLANDPGYQFQLQQGTEAMNRANSAGGNLDSGEALKAAQRFGTGLADSTYNAAFQRWLQNNQNNYNILAGQQGVGRDAVNNAAGYNTEIGNTRANATAARNNTMTGTLASILSGSGARRIIGYKPDGTAIYA